MLEFIWFICNILIFTISLTIIFLNIGLDLEVYLSGLNFWLLVITIM